MASFLRITIGDTLSTQATATSQAFYIIRGSGSTTSEHGTVSWITGDMMVVPVTQGEMQHTCNDAELGGAAIYWIHDQPLLDYLGVAPSGVKKFEPTLYRKSDMLEKVQEIRHDDTRSNNRFGVLLGNAKCAQTKTLTHVLWSLLNSIPGNSVQRPHRHNSVALDLCVSASPNVYTLMGREIDDHGYIIDPIRCDWAPGGVFVTPPGWWHSHHNESNDTAWVLPIQDAGLFTHQRTLDIRFVDEELALHRSGRIRGSAFVVSDDQFVQMKELSGTVPRAASCDATVVTDHLVTTTTSTISEDDESAQEEEKKTEQDDTDQMAEGEDLFTTKDGEERRPLKRRASIQVGSLARQGAASISTMTSGSSTASALRASLARASSSTSTRNQQHRRRKSIQVGADLEYLKCLARPVTSFS